MAPTDGFAAPTPHGPITRLCDGVHLVRGTFRMGPGLMISRTMTIVETPEGLAIVNSVRLDAPTEAQLVAMGKVAHVIKGEPLVKALAEVKDLGFANLVTGHGPAVIGGADAKVREAIAAVTGQG